MGANEIYLSKCDKCELDWIPYAFQNNIDEFYSYYIEYKTTLNRDMFIALAKTQEVSLSSFSSDRELSFLKNQLIYNFLDKLSNASSLNVILGIEYRNNAVGDAAPDNKYFDMVFNYDDNGNYVNTTYNLNQYFTDNITILGTPDTTTRKYVIMNIKKDKTVSYYAVDEKFVEDPALPAANKLAIDISDLIGIIFKRSSLCHKYKKNQMCHDLYNNDVLCNSHELQTQKKIQKTVGVSASTYSIIKASMNVYDKKKLATGLNWNQSSDRNVAHNVTINVPRYLMSNKPGMLSAKGSGVDVKHNSYTRYLAQKKQKSVRQEKGVTTSNNSNVIPISGNKRYKLGIVYTNSCYC